MLLKEWLKNKGLRQMDFAYMNGIGLSTLHKYLSGELPASRALAEKIEKATNGEITREQVMWPERHP